MARAADLDGALVAVIADEDTITGFLLAGVGDVDIRKRSNFLVVDSKTTVRAVEAAFKDFTSREDVAIVLISQPIANMIRHVVSTYSKVSGCLPSTCPRQLLQHCPPVVLTAAAAGGERFCAALYCASVRPG